MIINPDTIANAIADAPAWALVGLTVPSDELREDAARELATYLYRRLYGAPSATQQQLRLPL